MSHSQESPGQNRDIEEVRKLWVEAVELIAENAELKRRVQFLEYQIAVNAFGGWQQH
jgi:hypothetical protein